MSRRGHSRKGKREIGPATSERRGKHLNVSAPQRLLIRAPNWLGDAVMALPALAAVRAGLPQTRITIAAIASVAPLFHEATSAAPDDVVTIPDRSHEANTLREGRFDAGLLLTNSFRSAWAL